ncbi:MAG TPA: hypothetical protein VFM74_07535, partial [Candidatus Limnocylindria bacterium]|nr:hypothetical protein [Candidatus Limnocylindria bacterium]
MVRTLADRLATVRRPAASRPSDPTDRTADLARWFGARLVAEGSGAVVVERSVPLPPAATDLLVSLPAATYFDTETTGLSTGAGTVIFLAAIGRVCGNTFVARQYLLPDYP